MNFTQRTTLHGISIGNGIDIPIPDIRAVYLAKNYDIIGKIILEPGCLEGICTLSLLELGAIVRPFDIRQENVDKTNARLEMYAYLPVAFKADYKYIYYESELEDIIFHAGVLYHLVNPVENIFQCSLACKTLFLDTHYAVEGDQFCGERLTSEISTHKLTFGPLKAEKQEPEGLIVSGKWYREDNNIEDVYAGTEVHSFWPTEYSLINLLSKFYKDVKILYNQEEEKRIFILSKN